MQERSKEIGVDRGLSLRSVLVSTYIRFRFCFDANFFLHFFSSFQVRANLCQVAIEFQCGAAEGAWDHSRQ